MPRRVYLKMMPLAEARRLWLEAFDWPALAGREVVRVDQALGRVSAGAVAARLSSPMWHLAAMDGVALKAEDTFGARPTKPVRLEVGRQCWFVNTGQPLPEDADAVVMIEHIHQPAPGVVELLAPAYPWQHVRRVGEDMVAGEILVGAHQRLGPPELAALLTAGVEKVEVLCRPRVVIIPTGSELITPAKAFEQGLKPGQVLETNSVFLSALAAEAGAQVEVLAPRPDDPDAIAGGIREALELGAHIIVTNAGASAGERDFTYQVVEAMGEVLVHGVSVMPGKPTLLGRVEGVAVVGSPGYPVSAWVCFREFIAPALMLMQGRRPPEPRRVRVVMARPVASKLGQEEIVRVQVGEVGGRVVAAPLKRGAGVITSLLRAGAVVRVGAESEGVGEGEEVEAELLVEQVELGRVLMVIGSHDLVLELMASELSRRQAPVWMNSVHVGSLGGLVALARGRAHMAGTHLLEPATGEYNTSYVREQLGGMRARLVTVAWRQQGLMVAPGNPKGIRGLEDLVRGDVRFINRQRGAGTRVLLDWELRRLGLDPGQIQGYEDEEYTHMAVAVAVASGAADAGMGILAAAKALGLEFIPVAKERFDLCIPEPFWEDERVAAALELLGSARFRRRIEALGGYDTAETGRIAWEG